jgi:hypothetical protein
MILEMTPRQHAFAILLAVCLLAFVLELVRRRQLREDYSWLWILASGLIAVLVMWPKMLVSFTRMTGAVQPITAVSILGIIFLMVVCIHLCTKLTVVNGQVKKMAQEIAIINASAPKGQENSGNLRAG